MSFGFEASNSSGKTTISSAYQMWKFGGKCSVSYDDGNTLFRSLTYKCPSLFTEGIRPLMFVTLADGSSARIVIGRFYLTAAGNDPLTWHLDVRIANSGPTLPEVYCFYQDDSILDISADEHGLRIFSEENTLIFDSGWPKNKLLNIKELIPVDASAGQQFTTISIAKPALLFRFYYHYVQYSHYDAGVYWYYRYNLTITRAGNTYTVVKAAIAAHSADGAGYGTIESFDGRIHYLPIIDAADYD